MVKIGENAHKRTVALITNMDIPLGNNIGNSLEVREAVETLQNKGPEDLTRVCVELAANMLYLAEKGDLQECRRQVSQALEDGSGLQKLIQLVEAQGGDSSVITNPDRWERAKMTKEVVCPEDGYITFMDTRGCGVASCLLGAGREKKGDSIDYSAGIVLRKKTGDRVNKGDVLAVLYAADEGKIEAAQKELLQSVHIGGKEPENQKLIYARVTKDGVEIA
jgi:pyrimidine-nucleoside phosphorylase